MPPEFTTATPNWTALEGKVLEGGYEVEQCLMSGATSATFAVRVLGDRFTDAVVNVYPAGVRSPDQFSLWNDALELTHPNLSSPLALGELQWEGTSLLYVVLRNAHENLAGVVLERFLIPEEARELLQSITDALQYLHSRGFVHAHLAPEEVLAIGNSIQLSTVAIRRINTPLAGWQSIPKYQAPESEGENLTTASDIWCLGATLFEVLSQKVYAEHCRAEADSFTPPFNLIAARCLEQDPQLRCTLASVQAMLRGEQLKPAAMPWTAPKAMVATVGGGLSEAGVTGAPLSEAPRPAMPRLAAPAKPVFTDAIPIREEGFPEYRRRQAVEPPRTKFWSYSILGAVLFACLIWLVWPRDSRRRVQVTPDALHAAGQQGQQSAVTTPLPGSQSRLVEPRTAASLATKSAPAVTGSKPAPIVGGPVHRPAEVWRVVVYTFARREDAEKRVRIINGKHLGFSPEVLSANAPGPYLVVVGGRMSRAQALEIRRSARKAGLPRDSYVQNFDR